MRLIVCHGDLVLFIIIGNRSLGKLITVQQGPKEASNDYFSSESAVSRAVMGVVRS